MRRVPLLGLLSRGSPLLLVSVVEVASPFIRMIVLSHVLDLRELGFASALAATYGMFEQVTDIAMYRFVFSSPRADYEEALAAAHALSVARGAGVCLLVVLSSPLIALVFGLPDQWTIFAALGAIVIIKSFEHLGPRVAERNYQYGAQLKCILAGAVLGFAPMLVVAIKFHSHVALYAQLLGLAAGYVAASHIFCATPYRLNFRTPHLANAFRFGYPLMVNGAGLAFTMQGDRMLVGALLGLPALAIYSVVLMATIVPVSFIIRITASITLAALHNASELRSAYEARIKLAGRAFPLLFAFYGLSVIALANIVTAFVFGGKFRVSDDLIVLLAFGAFFRIARGDPFTSILLQTSRTKRLAATNLSSIAMLIFIGAIAYYYRTIELAMLGRLLGELAAFAVTLYLMRHIFRTASLDHAVSMGLGTALIGVIAAATYVTPIGHSLIPSVAALALGGATLLALTLLSTRNLWRVGFPHHGGN